MNFVSRLRAIFGTRQAEDVQTVRIFSSGATPSGAYVDADNALKNAAVWACVNYLARTIAQLPWRVMQDMGDAAPRRVPMHPVGKLLALRPNPEMSAFTFRETLIGWAARHGNGVAEIVTDNRNVPVALWPLHPSRVAFERDEETGAMVYAISGNDGETRHLDGSRVMHVKGFGEGVVGLNVIAYAAESIGWARATEIFGATFFGNGANPDGFLKFEGKLTQAGKDNVEKELRKKHGGAKRGNRTMILDNGWTFEKSSVEPDAAQFIETRQHQVEEICRWFGVPPHKVMHLLRSTFNNIEHQSIEVVVDAVSPWVIRFEEEGNYKLFGANRQGFYTDMDMRALLRGDNKSRAEYLKVMREMGAFNVNEVREYEGENPIGPAGDKRIVQSQYTTLDRIGEEPTTPSSSSTPAKQPDHAEPDPDDAEPDPDDAEDPPSHDQSADMAAAQRAIAAALRIEAHAS